MLQQGSSGTEVEALQRRLTKAGFDPGPVDGAFGPKTAAAVRAFQESEDLGVDGIAGPKTMQALLSTLMHMGGAPDGGTDDDQGRAPL